MLSFHVKFVQTDKTDGLTDRWTMVKQYAPDLWIQGLKNDFNNIKRTENTGKAKG